MAIKPSKMAIFAKSTFFDGFLAITRARDDIFENHFFSWLSFIYTQLLMPMNPKPEIIYFLNLQGGLKFCKWLAKFPEGSKIPEKSYFWARMEQANVQLLPLFTTTLSPIPNCTPT